MNIKTEDRHLADAVLAIIKNYEDNNDDDTDLLLHEYDNGREHGYVLELQRFESLSWLDTDKRMWVAFSEYRRSDDIVVYHDKGTFDGHLTDFSYDAKTFFKYNEIFDAANYIRSLFRCYVLTALKEEQKV